MFYQAASVKTIQLNISIKNCVTYIKKIVLNCLDFSIRGQISSCGFARDGITTVSFHRSVFISMRWKAVISRY